MCSLKLTRNLLTLRDKNQRYDNWCYRNVHFHLPLRKSAPQQAVKKWCLRHDYYSKRRSTRSGFRNKEKGIFSSAAFAIQAFLLSWLYQKPSEPERNASWMEAERWGSRCFHTDIQAVCHTRAHTDIWECKLAPYTSQIWQVNPGCKSFQC